MSFKDLTNRVLAAIKPKPGKTATTSAKGDEAKAVDTNAPTKSKTS